MTDPAERLYDPATRTALWRNPDDEPEPHPRAPTPHGPMVRRRCKHCGGWRDASDACIGAAEACAKVAALAAQHRQEREERGFVARQESPRLSPEWIEVQPQPAALEVGMHLCGLPSCGIGVVELVDEAGAVVAWGSGTTGVLGAEWRRHVWVIQQRPDGREERG